ncbi:unnamed protein product [Effrenium voratum]|nr:unnamed protein product [Effrenium voratum]
MARRNRGAGAAALACGTGLAFLSAPSLSTPAAPHRSHAKAEAGSSGAGPAALLLGAVAGVSARPKLLPRSQARGVDVKEPEVQANVDVAVAEVAEVANGEAVLSSWQETAFRRMWTRADSFHVHAISGTVHTIIGLAYLLDVLLVDIVRLAGGQMSPHLPFELVLASMGFGAVNAITGLQPSLLPRPTKTIAQLLGFGEDGNLSSGGFVNTAGFYFFLTYQSLRVLPEYPTWLQPFDPLLSATAFISIFHAMFLINSWVQRGKLDQALAIGMSAPLMLNVPVSLHLIFQGQSWVEGLSRAYPGWPEVFFSSNYALAWAGSMVTLILSVYERKVCTLEQRNWLVVLLGFLNFLFIGLQAKLLVPQWFQGDWMVMLTLNPPS